MKIHHNEPYKTLRQKAYPSTGDQLDAIFKMALALRDSGISLPKETLDWLSNCEEVKHTFKKG